jgi:hypothetical protein
MSSQHNHGSRYSSTSKAAGSIDADLAAEAKRATAAEGTVPGAIAAAIAAHEATFHAPVVVPPSVPVLPPATSAVTFLDQAPFAAGLSKWGHNFHPPGIAPAMYDPALSLIGADGLLHLRVEKRLDGWHGAAIDAKDAAGAQFHQLYGIEEVVFRLPVAAGGWFGGPWDYDNSGAEIDGLEVGTHPLGTPGGLDVGTAHCTIHFAGGGSWNGGGGVPVGDLSKGWHVIRREWRSTFVSCAIDGKEIRRYDASAPGWVGKIPAIAMPLILDMTVDTLGKWPGMGPPDATTPPQFDALIAAVRVQA